MKNIYDILKEQSLTLDTVIVKQQDLRFAINNKNWSDLMTVISEINLLMDKFNQLDEERSKYVTKEDFNNADFSSLLSEVRGKLVRTRTENKVLTEYINITRNFVQSVIDNVLPQGRTKIYSNKGSVVQNQPQSIIVNTLY